MSSRGSLQVLFDRSPGARVPLPPRLARFYGPLRLRRRAGASVVIGNLATTLDGVASFGPEASKGGGEITGSDPEDRRMMGLLRALADAVIVGAGTVRASPRHRWTPSRVFPAGSREFAELRVRRRQSLAPRTVIVTSEGRVEGDWPVFSDPDAVAEIVTTPSGARSLLRAPRSRTMYGSSSSPVRADGSPLPPSSVRSRPTDLPAWCSSKGDPTSWPTSSRNGCSMSFS